ncbi:unnamed protein product [Nezara viridula]|uniref:EF-hand domain-containing protein n=1 Tax=Nezara viridula TaxID=85310 RepID=A0A9P0HAV0_NEZVI|nr:unnamed protein product [Nezara viridula]
MLLPLRLGVIVGLLVLAWLLACLGMVGLSEEDITQRPLLGWRRKVKNIIAKIMCMTYRAGGMSVVVKGRQASRSQAPILVIAPHSTFLDAVIVYVTGFPSIIVRKESGSNPWLGKLINYTQPVYVRREDHDSRQKTVQELINRVNSKEDWSQMLIFPEGTCTNRSCLITFKPGAFYPGLPIQPVLIRYPNKVDTVTWTWEGPGVIKLMWLTLVQPQSVCEIEFLPVYTPSEIERRDPKLYAHNVRQLMARALGIPTLDYTYDDCKLVSRAKKLSFSKTSPLVRAHQLRVKIGLSRKQKEEELLLEKPGIMRKTQIINYQQFAEILEHPTSDPDLQELFSLYDREDQGYIDLREYLLSVVLVNKSERKAEMVHQAFEVFGGKVTSQEFDLILGLVFQMSSYEINSIFAEIDINNNGYITYEEFEEDAVGRQEFSLIYGSRIRRPSTPKDETKTK